jgi:hypothetical protein
MWVSLAGDFSKEKSNIAKTTGLTMIYFGLFPILFFISKGEEYLAIILFSIFFLIFFMRILSKLEKKVPFLEKIFSVIHQNMDTILKEKTNEKPNSSFYFFQKAGAILFILLIPFMLAFFAGKNDAKEKVQYDVLTHKRLGELAVVRIYSDLLIGVPFDRSKKQFANKYVIADIKSLDDAIFTVELIGPLRNSAHSMK